MNSVEEEVSNTATAAQENVINKAKEATARTMEEEVTARKNKKAEEAESKKHLFEAKAEDSNFRYDDYPVLPGQTDVADGTKAVAEETGHNLPGPANPNQPPGA